MKSFTHHKINSPLTLGEKLCARRLELCYSLDDVSKALNMQKRYIIALESGDFSNLPSDVYTDNFFKSYIKFLSLNQTHYLKLYNNEKKVYKKINNKEKNKTKSFFYKSKIRVSPRFFRFLAVFLILLALGSYIFLETRKIFAIPFLNINEPADNLVISDYIVDVVGQTQPESYLTINGKKIIVNKEGFFTETVSLHKGLNVIEISTKKKYSEPNVKYRQVMVVDDND